MPHAKKAQKRINTELPGTKGLRKGLDVLNIVASAEGLLRFGDLVERSALPNATLDRVIKTLLDYRFVHFEEVSQTYRLGPRTFEMAHIVWNNFDLRSGASAELDRLYKMINESARLVVLKGDSILVVDSRETSHALRLSTGLGQRVNPVKSALGKAILAYSTRSVVDTIVAGIEGTDKLELDAEVESRAFWQQLALSKARGYTVSVEEEFTGVNSVAAAILDHKLQPIGAIGVAGPSCRLTEKKLHLIAGDVMKAARSVSGNIGEVAMSVIADPRPKRQSPTKVKCVAHREALLGEGPVWLSKSKELLWVDILKPEAVITQTTTGKCRHFPLNEIVSCIVEREAGGYVATSLSGVYTYDAKFKERELICSPEDNTPGNRFNDGKCDARGRLWTGTMAIDASPGKGSLYRIETDGTFVTVESGLQISNGLGWSPDNKTFYFTDSGTRKIYAYDFELESGKISNKRVFAEVTDGEARPDGLAVDSEGYIWCAHWNGWRIVRYAPNGTIEKIINLPIPKPTSCAFGGPDKRTLFVTSARVRLSAIQIDEAPLSGGVFAIDTDVKGAPVHAYAG